MKKAMVLLALWIVFFVVTSLSGDGSLYSAWLGFEDSDFDYLIKVKGFATENRITNLRMEKRKYNACVPFAPMSEYFYTLADFRLNGQVTDDFVIEMHK